MARVYRFKQGSKNPRTYNNINMFPFGDLVLSSNTFFTYPSTNPSLFQALRLLVVDLCQIWKFLVQVCLKFTMVVTVLSKGCMYKRIIKIRGFIFSSARRFISWTKHYRRKSNNRLKEQKITDKYDDCMSR